jgi:hypothetical protein
MRTRTLTRGGPIVAVVLIALLAASCVTGPITSPGNASFLSPNVAAMGYQQSEFFLTGVARSYGATTPMTPDGKFEVAANGPTATYKTRLVVERPVDPARFNGTVIVEWLNVSTGADVPTDWLMAHNQVVRDGEVYVGVSAQVVGVNALKNSAPARYSSLVHPGDSYSYDIFTQAAQRIRTAAAQILGGLQPQRLIATGESQSAARMVTYIDAIQPIEHAYNGFMVHSRGAGGSSLSQPPLPSAPVPSPLAIRDDLEVPVMVLQSEFDVIGSNLGARQRDTPMFREWEIAGTAHADAYTVSVSGNDIGNGDGAKQMFNDMLHPVTVPGCTSPINAGVHHWVLQAAFHELDRWVSGGAPPPAAPPLVVASTSPVVLVRDQFGNARGGIRSPQVDAPVARLDGLNSGPNFCRLFGSTTPFTSDQLHALYSSHDDFVSKWVASLYADVIDGYLLPQDASELATAAQASTVPN